MKNKTCGECRHLECAKKIGFCQEMKYPLCPAELPSCANFEQKIITNGDVIRQMSNEELAEFNQKLSCEVCGFKNTGCFAPAGKPSSCKDGVLAWLNAPAEGEGKDE